MSNNNPEVEYLESSLTAAKLKLDAAVDHSRRSGIVNDLVHNYIERHRTAVQNIQDRLDIILDRPKPQPSKEVIALRLKAQAEYRKKYERQSPAGI